MSPGRSLMPMSSVIVKTLEETPKNATHWSTSSMAAATGMSQSAISRIWRAFALAPHRTQTSLLSTDPLFIDKVRDVVGLYLDPPEKALVLCVDEKSQIRALDRSQPVLPMMPGVPERRSQDYVRAGTTTLFAALEVASGKHAHELVVAEPGRAVVRRAHTEEAQARRPPLGPGTRTRHPGMVGRLERGPQAVRLDENS
ncbi:hypothetical protein T261_8311 [Streptomyces lydicus]|nr:hypothetical protein T261_8311 [Streptomyces lydicus]